MEYFIIEEPEGLNWIKYRRKLIDHHYQKKTIILFQVTKEVTLNPGERNYIQFIRIGGGDYAPGGHIRPVQERIIYGDRPLVFIHVDQCCSIGFINESDSTIFFNTGDIYAYIKGSNFDAQFVQILEENSVDINLIPLEKQNIIINLLWSLIPFKLTRLYF